MTYGKIVIWAGCVGLATLAACSGNDHDDKVAQLPDDLIQATLQVTMSEGEIDYNKGAQLTAHYSILIGGRSFELVPTEDIEAAGLFNERLSFLGGQQFLVRGDISGNEFHVSYLQYLNPEFDPRQVYKYRNAEPTELHEAVMNCQDEPPDISAANPDHLNARDKAGVTPLVYAAAFNCTETFHDLLEAGADPNVRGITNGTLLHHVLETTPSESVLDTALAHVENVNAQTYSGATPLYRAVAAADAATVKRLLDLGADPNVRTYRGHTSLHVAAAQGSLEKIVLLLENGADYRIASNDGKTPLELLDDESRQQLLEILGSRWQETIDEAPAAAD